jgi:branched-chain amino acid transport system substrate-binding protein
MQNSRGSAISIPLRATAVVTPVPRCTLPGASSLETEGAEQEGRSHILDPLGPAREILQPIRPRLAPAETFGPRWARTFTIDYVRTRSILSIFCLVAGACGGSSSGTVLVGAAGPYSERTGDMTRKGVELAVAEINAAGGAGGRRIELVERDDSGSGRRAAAVAQEFVANPSIVGVVGHVTSGAMVAAAKVYDGNLAAIGTATTSPQLTGISPWVFRVSSSDSINGTVIARFANALGRKRAAIIYENDSYGRGLAAAFRQTFKGQIVSIDPITADLPDPEPYISYYKKAEPDIVFAVGLEVSGLTLLREARRQQLAADFVGGDGWVGVVSDTALAEGVYVGTIFTAEDPRPEVQKFVAAFRERYGFTPDMDAATGYDAMHVMALAIANAGSDRAAIRRYLASFTEKNAYHGVTGVVRFGGDGDPVEAPYRVTRIHQGAFVLANRN